MNRKILALAFAAGALAALGQAPFSFWPATLLGLAVLAFLHQRSSTARRAAWSGWFGGTGYFGVSLNWIVEPFLVDAASTGWMAPFALVGLAGGLALFWALAAYLARRAGADLWRWALLMGLAGLARSYLFTGFPWALPGYAWAETPVAQSVAWIGPHGLNTLTMVFAAALATAAALYQASRGTRRRAGLMLAAPLATVALLWGFGLQRLAQPLPDATGVTVRLAQPNAAQEQKWDPDYMPVFFNRLLDFTAAPARDGAPRPDLIVWPETSVPAYLEFPGETLNQVSEAASGVPVVLGIQRYDGGRAYNSMAVLGGNQGSSADGSNSSIADAGSIGSPASPVTDVYDKAHLVPFGEYLPFPELLARIGLSAFTAQKGYGFTPGPGPRLLDLGAAGKVIPLICYEAIFPQDLRGTARPDWILQITNDAWFGNGAGPLQHVAQARMRAIEQGLPFLRAANTGVSTVIDARGQSLVALPLNTQGWVDASLPAALPVTLYSRTGDMPLTALLLLLALVSLRKRRQKTVDA
jgi:apolipoprotein N-acyltransferase